MFSATLFGDKLGSISVSDALPVFGPFINFVIPSWH